MRKLFSCFLAALSLCCGAAEEAIDASDPTKIYTFVGGGPKYTDFTNGEQLWEMRVTGNFGLSEHDMVLFEFGYGRIDGSDELDAESNITDQRLRWFHLFEMDYEAIGYRGMGTQVDLQLAGSVRGTDGQNVLVTGVMPTWNLTQNLGLYLSLNLVNSWDKRFEKYNGLGAGFDAQLIYSNENWWPGAQIRLIPVYNRFFTGELDGEGSGSIDINVGGEITPTLMWDVTYQLNLDKDLNTFRRGRDTDLENDWNVFFNITRYF